MKKSLLFIVSILLLPAIFLFVGCSKENLNNIELNKTELSLFVGETEQLELKFSPENVENKSVTWTTTNNAVANVDEKGEITAIGNGYCVIIVTSYNGKTAYCNVRVNAKPVMAEDIQVDKEMIDLLVGDNCVINATVLPENTTDKSLIWTSSNNEVITIDNGFVKAVGIGNTEIIITTSNNIEKHIQVHVKVVLASSVSLDKKEAVLKKGELIHLEASVIPENATDKTLNWKSENNQIAWVDNWGNVEACGLGKQKS